ncbi:MAG: tetracycline resistance MFS efflux pump [Ignavibacteriaceae bacterium]
MNKRTPLTLIFITVFIDLLGFGILIPILPTFATKELGVDESAVGFAIAIYSLTQFFFNPVFGKLSDKYGRRPVIIFSLLLNSLGYLIFAFTTQYWMLIVARIIAGTGGSSIGVAQAYIADVTTKEERSRGMGLIGAAFGLGFVFGPFIGGILSEFGYMITGFGSASFSFLAFIFTLILLPESNLNRGQKPSHRTLLNIEALRKISSQKDLSLLIFLFFILTFSIANIYGTFALLGHQVYGFSELQNGYIYSILGISSSLMQGGILNLLLKFIPRRLLILFGSLLMMFGLALLPYGGTFWGLAVIIVLLSFGTGSLQPILLSLVSEVTHDSDQGMVLGINQSASAMARVLGPLWGGFAFEFLGYPFPFLTGALFTSVIFFTSIFYLPKKVNIE